MVTNVKNKSLFERMKRVLLIYDSFVLFLLAMISLLVLSFFDEFSPLLVIVIGAFVLILLNKHNLFKDISKQNKIDTLFSINDDYYETYDPLFFWSDDNKKVLKKYADITDRKNVMETCLETTRNIALRQQINPHFLYNTLDSIRGDLLSSGNTALADTVESMSRYFSYVASNLQSLATIDEELSNIKDYFKIQEYRFENRFKMKIDNDLSDNESTSIYIPRLTLQPLVENAIIHGFEKERKHGLIRITISTTFSFVSIHVIDNGIGMDETDLNDLNKMLNLSSKEYLNLINNRKTRHGIALYNISSRIKLLFGEEYGIHVYSMKGVGTDFYIFLPIMTREMKYDEK